MLKVGDLLLIPDSPDYKDIWRNQLTVVTGLEGDQVLLRRLSDGGTGHAFMQDAIKWRFQEGQSDA